MSEDKKPKRTAEFDVYELDRQRDIAKSRIFMGKNAAYLGPLMSSMPFIWTTQIKTACTDGNSIWFNPIWFMKLDPRVRPTIILHELWHPARLHMVRRGTRDPLIWNYGCDIRINNDLDKDGHPFHGTQPWLDHTFDASGRAAEEDIYDQLMAMADPELEALKNLLKDVFGGSDDDIEDDGLELPNIVDGDMVGDLTPEQIAQAVNNVVQAAHQARMSGHPGDIPGEVETMLKQFLAPVVAWEILLFKFFFELLEEDYSWSRPNRRYPEMYLPSKYEDEGKLDHLIYYFDVSGSVTDPMVIRFNSEVRYIKETFNPKKLTLVQFDTRITQVREILENEDFNELLVEGRGGTDLTPVREHMLAEKPTAAIVFSDLECAPMEKLPFDVPTIWICLGNKDAQVNFGQIVHIRA